MPTVTWYKDGQVVISSSQALYIDKGQFLHIPRAQVSDSATYTCHASNVAGMAEKSFRVDIYGKDIQLILPECLSGVLTSSFLTHESLRGAGGVPLYIDKNMKNLL